ncbi:lactonase family protein [Vibrio sp. FNV 38]|nr:lactonase family protein [Vibrio sp. FNV 38]
MTTDTTMIYVGCYTDPMQPAGVAALTLNLGSGSLSYSHSVLKTTNPSFVLPTSAGLYTFNEMSAGEGASVQFLNQSGAIQVRPSEGDYPCHLATNHDRTWLALAHYGTGNVNLYCLLSDGKIDQNVAVLSHEGNGPNRGRQEASHAHMVHFLTHSPQLWTVDLGTDRIAIYQLGHDDNGVELIQALQMPAGSGPRHLVLNHDETRAYVVCELSETLVTLSLVDDQWQISDEQSLMPDEKTGEAAAAIKMSPDGRFVYVSCRAQNTVVQFDICQPKPQRVKAVAIQGQFPRDFLITDDGKWCVVANQHSNSIECLSRCTETGILAGTEVSLAFHAPVCLIQSDQCPV